MDKLILKPIAQVYHTVLPNQIRTGVTHFFVNFSAPATIINDILQGNFLYAYSDTWRFLINSTLGIGGFFDVAKPMRLTPHETDFGITLAKWGITKSPYLVIPFFGPSTITDFIGINVDYFALSFYPYIHPWYDRYALISLNLINQRANLFDYQGVLDAIEFDPYIFQRNAYLQQRESMLEQSKAGTGFKIVAANG